VRHFTYPSVLLGVMYSDNMLSSSRRRYNLITDRLERILTMVYVVQNSQNFSGLFPSSCSPVIEISSL
jgi:hypothetical protein